MVGMVPVAVSERVTVFCPENGKFSFFNSPYPMHRLFSGIDVFPRGDFGEIAPSPIEGRVVKIRKVKCPRGRGFMDSGFDCVTLLESLENPERVVKVLHVDPVVENGEVVEAGQPLGRLIRSGYFNFWTEPHIHLEVRKPSDPLRARGGFTFRRLLAITETRPMEELRGTVTKSTPEYSLLTLKERSMIGLPAEIGGRTGLFDGGIPHYQWFGVHTRKPPYIGSPVKLCGKTMARIKNVHDNMGLAKCTDFSFTIDGVRVGLSLFLTSASEPEIKIVPYTLGALDLEESSEIEITIN